MNIARICYPVEVLGPGKRVGIWFRGCRKRCPGCSNPELWEPDPSCEITAQGMELLIAQALSGRQVDGFTFTGGEPLDQPEALQELVGIARRYCSDILVYTGYRIDEVPREYLRGVSALVDGEYVEALNTKDSRMRGSLNQGIHILDPVVGGAYSSYIEQEVDRIQNFAVAGGTISVGMHGPSRRSPV